MKKLIPALCMLLISAALLGTSTYAWFSMNATVNATGMQVTAKSNAGFLLINDSDNAAEGAITKAAYYATIGNDEKKTYPTAYYADASTLNGHATEAGKWYTTSSSLQGQAVSGNNPITVVTEGSSNYMLTYKVWLTLSQDSEAISDKKIQVTFSLGDDSDVATSAVVLIGADGANGKFALNSTTTSDTTDGTVSLTNTTTVPVTVYVYIDGNSTNVYSDYINGGATITGSVNLQFDLVDNT